MALQVCSVKNFKDPARLVTIFLLATSACGWIIFVVGWGLFWHVRRFTPTASLSSGYYFPQWYYMAAGPVIWLTMLLRTCLMLPKHYGLIPAVVNMFLVITTFVLGGSMLTWTGVLLVVGKLLSSDTPYLAVKGLSATLSGGIISIVFLALATCASIFIGAIQPKYHKVDGDHPHLEGNHLTMTDGVSLPLKEIAGGHL